MNRGAVVLAVPVTLLVVTGCASPADAPGAGATTSTSSSSAAPISPRVTPPAAATPAATVDGFALGTAVALDYSWTVTVTDVDLDAADAVLAVDPEATAPAGRFVVVGLSATPTEGGVPPGPPAFDLLVSLEAGGETYRTCDGAAELGRSGLVSVAAGETVSWQVCLDVAPAAAVPTSLVRVQDRNTISVTGSGYPVDWSLD